MIHLDLATIATIVDGRLLDASSSGVVVTGSVETDSRLVGPGGLFVAKPGEVTDGHLFVGKALESGAVAALVERPVDASIPQIQVGDVVLALGRLAKHVLHVLKRDHNLKVIGITGSNGKTTTKNMLREILSTTGETVAPIESYNNEVGAPYSMLRCTETTRFLVAEMGAGGVGSIAYLAEIAKPDIAVELKVGLAHVGEFGGIEVTAAIKAELLHELEPDAIAVLNADDGWVRAMGEACSNRKVWFGTSSEANFRATDLALTIEGTSFELHWPDGNHQRVTLQILGEHHVMNALAALTVAEQLGIDRGRAIAALEAMPLAERWRMQLTNRPDGVTVINDAYNASPDSTKAALQTLAQLGRSGRRTIAVLGEMAELGEFSLEQHDAIGRVVVRLNIDQLVVVGERARVVHLGAMQEGSWDGESQFFEESDDALAYLREMLQPNDIVLVKSSKSANLRHLGDALTGETQAEVH
ncbi:MAG: UDP-N-acetylmuramoyl-tripeptide--D-alanyl-D-alanine ligase [Actinomycetales bacterium]|nr:UDP-N-acetylmuramoyl-tripeptide--D-alanyl-D-alanine ligase [Actinomycetales bacterium]